jgi:dihydrofolate reductase
MRITLWMAISLNGMIARNNNEEDFISHDSWLEWLKWITKSGCIVWGRKTYEIVKNWPKQYFDDISEVRKIIITSDIDYKVDKGFTIAHSPQEAVEILINEGFQSLLITGGSELNSSFAESGLIDEIVLNVEPVVVGRGIPVFSNQLFNLNLEFIKIRKLNDNLIQLQYKVL